MADTTVYTVSAGYLPFFANSLNDFDVQRWTKGQRRVMADGSAKWDGVELKGPEAIMPDGSLKKARIRGSIGWFEYSTRMKPLYDQAKSNQLLQEKLVEISKEFYGRDLKSLAESLTNSFISSGNLGEISPTGDYVKTGEKGTPEERFNPEQDEGFKVTHPSSKDVDLVGRANTIDMYVESGGNIYRLDVTAMTFDTKRAHHGLSSHADRVEKRVTGKDLLKDIKEGGHAEGSTAQKKLWNYFKGLNKGWNAQIATLKEHAHSVGDTKLKKQMDDLKAGRTSLDKLGTDFAESLEKIRGGSKGESAAKIDPRVARSRSKYQRKDGEWDRRFKKYKRSTRHQINEAFRNTAVSAATFSASVEFVLHALGNMIKIASKGAGQFGGKEYGYSTGIGLGEGLGGDFVVEVMHRVHMQGENYLLFKEIRSKDVIIHNEAHLVQVYRNKLLGLAREDTQAVHEQEAIRVNSSFSANLINDGKQAIEIGGITTAGMSQVAGQPKLGYAAVIAPQTANDDINKFIDTLHGNPKKIRKLLDTQGKTMNMTGKNKPYAKKWKESVAKSLFNEAKLGMSGRGQGRWGLSKRMGNLAKQAFDEKAIPDFWAAPYLTLLYPSQQMSVRQ